MSSSGTPDSYGTATVLTKLKKWGEYPSWGSPVSDTKFIPMKTPLSEAILSDTSTEPKHRLTLNSFLGAQRALGYEVGMIIDLCNHACLYEEDIPDGLVYCHLGMVAKEVPCREHVYKVAAYAEEFWAKHPTAYVAVHCTYGFNRTGFTLASYLVEKLDYSVEKALSAFAQARPPGVKHETFHAEFHARYERALPFGGLPACTVENPSECNHQELEGTSFRRTPKSFIRERVTYVMRILCSLSWLSSSKPSVKESMDGHLYGNSVGMSSCAVNAQDEQISQPTEDNDSLGPVARQALMRVRSDMMQKCQT